MCLDGDAARDRMLAMEPRAWTEEQYYGEIRNVVQFLRNNGFGQHTTTIRGKLIALSQYIEKAKQLLTVRYTDRPEETTREAFISMLTGCCGVSVPCLKLSWEHLIEGFYTDYLNTRKGAALNLIEKIKDSTDSIRKDDDNSNSIQTDPNSSEETLLREIQRGNMLLISKDLPFTNKSVYYKHPCSNVILLELFACLQKWERPQRDLFAMLRICLEEV